jgi:glycosyltransferase involved in cell wall biosynthesis
MRAMKKKNSQPSARRVLIVSPQPFYEDRGTPIAVAQLVNALLALEFTVDLLAYPIGSEVSLAGLSIVRSVNPLGFRRVRIGFSVRKILLDLGMLFSLWRLFKRQRYDVVHVLEELAFFVVPMCRRRGIPVIYDMQSSLPDQLRTHGIFRSRPVQAILRKLERAVLKGADVVVCSAGLLAHVKEAHPSANAVEWRCAGQTRLTDPDLPHRVRGELRLVPSARVVLYSGTFEPYQGIDLLIGAMPVVLEVIPEAVFVLIGATPDNDLYHHIIVRKLVHRGKLHILPRQPRDTIPAYLAMSEVLVSPRAYGDNIPLKIFDYMLSGKPIVATDLRAHRSILNDRTALLVDKKALALGEAIIRLMSEPKLAAELSQAALEEAGRYPGGQSFNELVRSLYTGALERREERVLGNAV